MVAEKLISLLQQRNWTVTTAESCTGGMIAALLIDVPGASWVLREAIVTYANEAKEKRLGVLAETLEQFGAVSEETAREMALGACHFAAADLSLISTGIAGPDGGTPEKPVGLVYIACCFHGETVVRRCQFSGNRFQVRKQAAEAAISLALDVLKSYSDSVEREIQ